MPADSSSSVKPFLPRTFTAPDGGELNYLLLLPRLAPRTRPPLLVFLHGAGQRGDDNASQLTWGREVFLAAAEEHGAVVAVPQCPQGQKWADLDWTLPKHRMPARPTEPMGLTLGLIDTLTRELPINPRRLYVMGMSMGGYGAWDLMSRRPELLAAAVVICGGGDPRKAKTFAPTPVWAFHGDKDSSVPVTCSRDMIEALKRAGGRPRYTELAGVEHNSWTPAFNEKRLLPWLFRQRREER